MANLKSSIKKIRQTERKTKYNNVWRNKIEALKKQIRSLERGESMDQSIKDFIQKAQKTLDKAAKKGVIHKNKASRLKSRWSKRLQNLTDQ